MKTPFESFQDLAANEQPTTIYDDYLDKYITKDAARTLANGWANAPTKGPLAQPASTRDRMEAHYTTLMGQLVTLQAQS